MGAVCQCGATDAACRLCVCARVWWEEHCPNKDAHMRNDSRHVGFANKQCHIHEHETYSSQLPAIRVTFYLELFDINRTRTLHSILRVKNVFYQGDGRSGCRSFWSRLCWQTVTETWSRVTELCNPSLLQLLLVSQWRTLMWPAQNTVAVQRLGLWNVPFNVLKSLRLNCYFKGGSHKM